MTRPGSTKTTALFPAATWARVIAPVARPRAIDPVVLAGAIGLLALVAVALHVRWGPATQPAMAIVVGAVFAGAIALSPTNGLVLLFLLPPFFNGEDFLPYFSLLEVLVYGTLLRGLVPVIARRRALAFPHAPFLLFFALVVVVALPLNLREIWLELRLSSAAEILEGIRRSEVRANLFYVRTVLNVVSGLGLYLLAANERWWPERLPRLILAATLIYGGVMVAGLWLYWGGRPVGARSLLSAYLHGQAGGGFSALGTNTDYYTQYAVTYLPLAGWLLVERTRPAMTGLALAVVVFSGYTILATYQRGAYVVFLLELLALAVVAIGLREGERRGGRILAGAVAGGFGLATIVLVSTPIGAAALDKLGMLWRHGHVVRTHLLEVVGRMFVDHPLLGVGTGRFAHFFQYYSWLPAMQNGSWSAHNTYAQFLAEQGALGLVAYLLMVGAVTVPALRLVRRPGPARAASLFVLISLGAWLTYGWVHYTLLMRSMQLYFWITLGILAGLASSSARLRLPRWGWGALLAVLALALGVRVHTVAGQPIRPGYLSGFYDQKEYLDADEVRWTHRSVAALLRVEDSALRLRLACPIPLVGLRPQTVSVWLDGRPAAEVVIDSPGWRAVTIPVEQPVGQVIFLRLRVGYVFVPWVLGLTEDVRPLGVALARIEWVDREGRTRPSTAPVFP